MSDVTLRMTLQDDVSSKIDQLSGKVKTAASQLKSFGRDMDQAFKTNSADTFAANLGNSMDEAASSAEAFGNAVDAALNSVDAGAAAALGENFEAAQTAAMGLADSTTAAGDGIRELADGGSAINELGSGADAASQSMENLSDAAEKAADEVADVGDGEELGKVADEAKNAGSAMEDAASRAETFGSTMKKVIAALGLAKLAGEIKEFVGSSIELGKGFTAQMSEVGAISGATGQQMEALESTARQYGSTTIFSASQAAEALKYMSLAGWDANQSTSALGGVLNLAAASGMGLGQASDMVTDYLSAFGMQASESAYFADMLSYAQAHSNTTAAQLGEAYLNSAAQMHAAGQDVETTTSLLEAMANQGTKGARAGTQLTAMARDITQHMKDGAITIAGTSIAVQDAEGNFRDFTEIIADVESAVDGLGSAERAAALGEVFTADSTKGINQILTEGVGKIAAYEQALRSSSGAAEEAAAVMNDNLAGDIANFNSATEEMKLKIFDNLEKPLRQLTQYGTGELIPALSTWLPEAFGAAAKGIGTFASAFKPLFELVIKNPKAVGTALASAGAGIATMVTVTKVGNLAKTVEKIGGLGGALTKLAAPLVANPWVAGAAAVAAGVTAIGLAVKNYNDLQVDRTLSEKFGNVEMTSAQMDAFAGKILNAQWLVNVEASVNRFAKAEDLRKQAEDALKSNDVIEWKAKIGIDLDDADIASYKQNIQSFIESSKEALENQTLAVSLALSFAEFTLDDGSSLGSRLQEWAKEDITEMTELSGQLTKTVQKALEDGIIDVDEQAAINLLQEKINNIQAGWKKAESDAQMKILEHEFGEMSGRKLTDEAFLSLIGRLQEQRETASEALNDSLSAALQAAEGLHNSGRLTNAEYTRLVGEDGKSNGEIWDAARNEQAEMLVRSMSLESNTLSSAFKDRIGQNTAGITDRVSSTLAQANADLAGGNADALQLTLGTGMNQAKAYTGAFSDAENQSLGRMWQAMKPDAGAMASLIDEYKAAGQEIPKTLMESFNSAMELGAAAGDSTAATQILANAIAGDEANAALKQAILDGTANVPKDLKEAVERAAAETTEDPVNFGDLKAGFEGAEVDESSLGAAVDEAKAEAQETADAAASEPVEATQQVEMTVESGGVDAGAAVAEAQDSLDSAFGSVLPAEGSTDVKLTKASDNIDAVYDQVGSEIESKFSNDYHTSANLHVSIHVDYSIANPSKTVTFGGAGSGSGTITAHALGGYFDEPHLGMVAEAGAEYIIPMNGSAQSLEMWREAGEMLGVFQRTQGGFGVGGGEIPAAGGNAAPAASQAPSGRSEEKTININIGGNGSIRVSGGGIDKASIVEMMLENLKDVFMQIVEQEVVEEGEGVYVY